MRKLWVTFIKDMKLSFNGLYFYIEIGLAVIFLAIMLFVVPENMETNQKMFLTLDSTLPDAMFEMEDSDHVVFLESRESVVKALEEDRSAIGAAVTMVGESLEFDVILQGYESERMINLMRLGIESMFMDQKMDSVDVVQIEASPERLSDREAILPVYITMNVGMMGLFIIAAYIFLDKEEGVIKAYAVAPVKVWQYLASKMLIMLIMGIITSLIVFVALLGFKVNYLYFIGMIIAFNLFGSSLGLFISSFFDTMVKAMGAMYAVIMIMILPTVAYFMPSFNPFWVKILPSYSMMFMIRDLISNQIVGTKFLLQILAFLGVSAVLFVLANERFKKSLTV
ncbi:ABC transporter permease [Fusibacter tunisiensis]|uniref:ABC-type Na+ efflux pump permease subunit n=1 Tax=Fusibacter tunisiensis TaxID=1008308 RepID=A0ABS2MN33_9FIRM|nr:ABC transporter permease [Fusibacter tunisiensis]MBM7560795.1 ABC-type Na+ efflux pump permease subunit [Fusibacter tunisiensis]